MLLQEEMMADSGIASSTAQMSDVIYYNSLLDRRIHEAVTQGAKSLSELCLAARGAFPSEVLAALERLALIDKIGAQDSILALGAHGGGDEWWPEPSPVDYEWRFTYETAERIATISLGLGRRILCLGTPTVFRSLFVRGAEVYLLDRNPLIAAAFESVARERIHTADVSDCRHFSNFGGFDVVVMDPPWYPSHVTYWLSTARKLLLAEGTIILTLFPELTRPEAGVQRTALLNSLNGMGTYDISLDNVSYETPLFERETLSALGIPPLPVWRVADLVTLRVYASQSSDTTAPPSESQWNHFQFGTQVVAVKKTIGDDEPIRLFAPYDDFTFLLRSVSTRDPVRSSIGLWTSRNRVANLTGNARVSEFLRILASGVSCYGSIEQIARDSQEEAALEMLVALIGW